MKYRGCFRNVRETNHVFFQARAEIMEKLVERAGKAEVEIEKLYAEFERLQKLQPEEGETPEELVRFVNHSLFLVF